MPKDLPSVVFYRGREREGERANFDGWRLKKNIIIQRDPLFPQWQVTPPLFW